LLHSSNYSNYAIPKSIGTAAGDIIYWSAASTPARLAADTDGYYLSLASGIPAWTRKRVYYGTCDTAAETAEKVVTCADYDALTVGDIVVVKFANTNSAAVANLKLNVNSTGAKPLKYMYNNTVNNIPGVSYLLNQVYICHYDGTNWVIDNMHYNTNTTYSAMSVAEMRTGTATSSRVMRADYLKTFLSTLGGTYLTLSHTSDGIVLNHDVSGVTANTYGDTSQQTPSHGGTFNIPYFTVDAQGHVTAASTTTVKLPTDNDTKNTAGSTDTSSKIFLIGATEQSANPQTYSDDEVFVTSGVLTAKTFNSTSLTDSTHSEDTDASVSISGGLSVAKNISAKSVRIDNNESSKGASLEYDATLEVLNFVFS